MKRVLLALALAATAHAEGRPRYKGVLEATLLGAPATLDPVLAQSHADQTIAHLVYDTLYCVEADGIAQPHLAVSLPAVDGKTARIAIRRGVKFHDGSELTARDVAASIERAQKGPGKWALAPIASVRTDGDLVELSLRGSVPDLATLLSLAQTSVTKGGKAPGDKPNGTGPFAIDSIDSSKHQIALKEFENHFAGRPYLATIVLHWYEGGSDEARKFETGDLQVSERRATEFATSQPVYKADDVESPASLLIYVAVGKGLGDKSFRRAVDLALARGSLVMVTSGERVVPTRMPVPVEAGVAGLDDAGKAENLAAARSALEDAGKRVPALASDKLSRLSLELLVDQSRPDDHEIGQRVVEALDPLGISAHVTPLSAKELRDRIAAGKFDLAIDQLAEPVTAASAWWGAAFAAGNDDWAEKQLAAGSIGNAAAQKVFAERLPIIPLMFRSVHVWHRTDVRGFGFDATGRIGFADLFVAGDPVRTKKGRP